MGLSALPGAPPLHWEMLWRPQSAGRQESYGTDSLVHQGWVYSSSDPFPLCLKSFKESLRIDRARAPRAWQGQPFWLSVALGFSYTRNESLAYRISLCNRRYNSLAAYHTSQDPQEGHVQLYLTPQSCSEEPQDCWWCGGCSSNNHPHVPSKTCL